jgi:hypothetical protein
MKRLLTVGVLTLTISLGGLGYGAESKEPLTVQEIQRLQSLKNILKSIDELKVAADRFVEEKFYHCMRAFGHNNFCSCLKEALPVGASFITYVSSVTNDKRDLKYDQLGEDDRKIVDRSLNARETCVKALAK